MDYSEERSDEESAVLRSAATKDLSPSQEILRFAQDDRFAVRSLATLGMTM
jgi:hypothetical protein